MDIEQFIESRQPKWAKLERLLEEAERSGDELAPKEIQDIVGLYRQACSDLTQARTYTANPDLLDRLNRLTGRGYRFVYRRGRTERLALATRRLLLTEIPTTFRREQRVIVSAMMAMVLGVLVGAIALAVDPSNGRRLIPPMFFTEDVRDRVERIEKEGERIERLDEAAAFGAFLYTHNIRVSLLAFSLGAITILGAYWLLFYNGILLGAIATTYVAAGEAAFFFAWVGPHGALELPAIVFGSAAGLRLGEAFWMPGSLSRASALRRAFPSVWRMLVATAFSLVLAGVIEGSFSQFSAKTFPYPLKISIAILLLASLVSYLFVRHAQDTEERA